MQSSAPGQRIVIGALGCLALVGPCVHAASPADYKQKVGVYVWGTLAPGLPAAAADVKRLGADGVVRVYIGPGASWDPADKNDHSPLDVKIRRRDYREFLAGFPVVMLTAYDVASFGHYKAERMDSARLAEVRDELRKFTIELAKTPGRKIISNWEFENDCPGDKWAGCLEYYQTRLDGIAEGRRKAAALGYPGQVFTAFEFTIVPGFAGKPSGLVEIGTKLKGVDFLSYSAWWSIGADFDAPRIRKSFEYLFRLLHDFSVSRNMTPKLIIGEFGEYWDMHPTAERLKAIVDTCLDNGVEYLFNWVLYDQPGQKDERGRDASHFGKYRLDGSLTPQGEAFRSWFSAPARRATAPGSAPSVH